jgi:hypothetical protein
MSAGVAPTNLGFLIYKGHVEGEARMNNICITAFPLPFHSPPKILLSLFNPCPMKELKFPSKQKTF